MVMGKLESDSPLIADILDFLNRPPVPPAIDAKAERPFVDEYKGEGKKRFLSAFLMDYRGEVRRNDDPRVVAPRIKKAFDEAKLRCVGALEEADAFSCSLGDLAEGAAGRIDFLERMMADFAEDSTSYRSMEAEVRKMNIIQMAAVEAKNLG